MKKHRRGKPENQLSVCLTFTSEEEKNNFVRDVKNTGRTIAGYLRFTAMERLYRSGKND